LTRTYGTLTEKGIGGRLMLAIPSAGSLADGVQCGTTIMSG